MIGALIDRWIALRDRIRHPDPLERATAEHARRRDALAAACRRPDPRPGRPELLGPNGSDRRPGRDLSAGKAPR